jgi:hypothetical protein
VDSNSLSVCVLPVGKEGSGVDAYARATFHIDTSAREGDGSRFNDARRAISFYDFRFRFFQAVVKKTESRSAGTPLALRSVDIFVETSRAPRVCPRDPTRLSLGIPTSDARAYGF